MAREFVLQNHLQEHYEDPFHRGTCEYATHAAESVDDGTGCQIRIEMIISDEHVDEVWFDGQGCTTCEGLASILMSLAAGVAIDKLQGVDSLPELAEMVDAAEYATLRNCKSLPLEVLKRALATSLDSIEDDLADGSNFGGPSLREEC